MLTRMLTWMLTRDAHTGSTLADYHILNFVSVIFVIVDGWRLHFLSGTR